MVPPAPRECHQRAPRSASRKCNQSAHRIPYNDCAAHRIPYNDRASPSAVRASHPVQRPRSASRNTTTAHRIPYNDRASHLVQRPRSASRKWNQSVEVRVSHPVQRPRIALRGPHTLLSTLLVSFRLVRGTIFSKIQYIYIFIPEHFMALQPTG